MSETQYYDKDGNEVKLPKGDEGKPTPKDGDKSFTQEQVDDIVKGRVAREQDKFKDYDALKVKAGELDSLKQKHDSLESENTKYKDSIQVTYDTAIEAIPEDKRSLIPDEYNLLAKLNYINTNKSTLMVVAKVEKKDDDEAGDEFNADGTPKKPVTPKKEDKSKGEGGLFGGKYKTALEYAEADPKAYLVWRKNENGKPGL